MRERKSRRSATTTTSDCSAMVPQQQTSNGSRADSPNAVPKFGSLLVDRKSSTPYSDATQVGISSYSPFRQFLLPQNSKIKQNISQCFLLVCSLSPPSPYSFSLLVSESSVWFLCLCAIISVTAGEKAKKKKWNETRVSIVPVCPCVWALTVFVPKPKKFEGRFPSWTAWGFLIASFGALVTNLASCLLLFSVTLSSGKRTLGCEKRKGEREWERENRKKKRTES